MTCTCKNCKVSKLNPAPDELALAQFQRHKARNTTPGNPKWYKVPTIKPYVFKPGQPPRYPEWVSQSGADWAARNNPNQQRGPVTPKYK